MGVSTAKSESVYCGTQIHLSIVRFSHLPADVGSGLVDADHNHLPSLLLLRFESSQETTGSQKNHAGSERRPDSVGGHAELHYDLAVRHSALAQEYLSRRLVRSPAIS